MSSSCDSGSCDLTRAHSSRFFRFAVPLGAIVLLAAIALSDETQAHNATRPAATQNVTTQNAGDGGSPKPADERYGAWVLVPPLVTIVLAIALRQVIPALAIGILVAAYMLVPCLPAEEAYGGGAVGGLRLALETYLFRALASIDPDTGGIDTTHLKIIVFTFMIGGMVGVVAANGGTQAVVDRVSRWASTRERGQLAAWFAGLIVFFDDYANAMIVGPSMRPMTDRLRISRAKLAYIVDSTAAPVSSIALIGTWVGAEIGYIDDGLRQLVEPPSFMTGVTAYGVFLASIPYRFYPILALVMVFLVGILGRDFGPMRKAEQNVSPLGQGESPASAAARNRPTGSAWYAVVPILVLVFLTMALLMVTGWPAGGLHSIATKPGVPRSLGVLIAILYDANANDSILYGALAALLVALCISLATRSLTLARCVDSATDVMARMLPTMIVLVFAWTLSAAMGDLRLGAVAVTLLSTHGFDPTWLPLLVFVSSCVVSFATGTSWGTMGILCPATVTIAAGLLGNMYASDALPLFYASVGAVLAGSVFGDHCSPISDTTVLSSLASECHHEQHVWTQIPYALTVAIVSTLCGEVLCRYHGMPAWVGLLAGSVALLLIVLVFGRRPRHAPPRPIAES